MNHYRFLHLTLASPVELPELQPSEDAPQLTFTVTARPPGRCETIHVWRDEDGDPTLAYARASGSDALVFPDVATFVMGRGSITAHTRADPATVRHCLLDQVLPRILAREGAVVLHAAAARIDEVGIVLFAGRSGSGKSTLLAHAASAGARLLSDDCVALSVDDGVVRGRAPYPSLRVYPDSRAATGLTDRPSDTFVDGSEKRRVLGFPTVDTEDATVEALFLLTGPEADVSVRPLSGNRALAALPAQLFTMDPTDLVHMRTQFDRLASILRAGVRVLELDHPHAYEQLAQVWSIVRARLRP